MTFFFFSLFCDRIRGLILLAILDKTVKKWIMSNKYHIEIFYLTENLIVIAECARKESKEVGKYTENEWNWMKLPH